MAKKVFITGANVFLGAALQEYFKEQQPFFKIFGVDCRISLSSRHFFLCSLNNQKEILEIISRLRPDYILYLAGGRMNMEKDILSVKVLPHTRVAVHGPCL